MEEGTRKDTRKQHQKEKQNIGPSRRVRRVGRRGKEDRGGAAEQCYQHTCSHSQHHNKEEKAQEAQLKGMMMRRRTWDHT